MGWVRSAASEDIPTTCPRPRARINGNKGRIVASAPVRLVSMTSLASCGVVRHTDVCRPPTPALAMTTSKPPQAWSRATMVAAQATWSVTSMVTAWAVPPAAPMTSTRPCNLSTRRAPNQTWCPRRHSSVARAAPIPEEAPVRRTLVAGLVAVVGEGMGRSGSKVGPMQVDLTTSGAARIEAARAASCPETVLVGRLGLTTGAGSCNLGWSLLRHQSESYQNSFSTVGRS